MGYRFIKQRPMAGKVLQITARLRIDFSFESVSSRETRL